MHRRREVSEGGSVCRAFDSEEAAQYDVSAMAAPAEVASIRGFRISKISSICSDSGICSARVREPVHRSNADPISDTISRLRLRKRRRGKKRSFEFRGSRNAKSVRVKARRREAPPRTALPAAAARRVIRAFQRVRTCANCQGKGQIIRNPCKACKGGADRERKSLEIRFRRRRDGFAVTRPGEGRPGKRGPAGDLFVVLQCEGT